MILRQGLVKSHVFWACLFCAISDALLICLGVAGFSMASKPYPFLPTILTFGGILFLVFYGLNRLWAAYRGGYEGSIDGQAKSLGTVIAALAAVTWLNPHVYLDTVVLLGSISTQYSNHIEAFTLGAISASFVFFYSLGYGSRVLIPVFQRPRAWQILEVIIGIIMSALAISLL